MEPSVSYLPPIGNPRKRSIGKNEGEACNATGDATGDTVCVAGNEGVLCALCAEGSPDVAASVRAACA